MGLKSRSNPVGDMWRDAGENIELCDTIQTEYVNKQSPGVFHVSAMWI